MALNSFIPGTAPVAGIIADEALAFRACAASTVITGSTATGAGSTRAKPCLIGGQGMPPEMFFSREADEFF